MGFWNPEAARRQNLLLIRLGYLRESALRSLLRRPDLRLALLDDQSAPYLATADYALPVGDVHDEAAVLDQARRFVSRFGAAGVLTFQDSSLQLLAQLAEEFDLPGWERGPLLLATNKQLTREALARRGLPSPRFAVVGSAQEAAAAVADLGLPAVMKPTDRSAGRGVVVVASSAGVDQGYRTAWANSLSGLVLIEEYMHGPEFSVESATAGGTTVILAIAAKTTTEGSARVEMGHAVPADLPADQARSVRELARDGLGAIGFQRGMAHTEIKLTAQGPRIVEINPRLAGDCIPELVELACGVDPYQVAADLATDRRPDVLAVEAADARQGAAIRFLSAAPGRVVAVEGVEEVASQLAPGLDRLSVFARVGDRVRQLSSNLERVGYVLAHAPTSSAAVSLAATWAARIRVVTEPV